MFNTAKQFPYQSGSGTGFQRCSGMYFDASGTLFTTCERNDGTNTHVVNNQFGDQQGLTLKKLVTPKK